MSEESFLNQIKDTAQKYFTQHPYLTITAASTIASYLGLKGYRAYSNLRSKNTIIEIDFTNLNVLVVRNTKTKKI